ncbi:uncharacterized protein LOC115964930 [Quercus lobata]|uniref:uncharacterized protein LOC115964930 n=1 Tax=Quercus lobata TaxID=97700 RepID=UPI001247C3FC|nr:uncharacterized protein LOC115964930 [Quercus lobata]
MRILGWNCRGICNASTVRALGAQIKGARTKVVFLSETKADVYRMEFFKKNLKFDESCVVEANGNASGLCLMWKFGIDLKVVEFNKDLIAVKVSDQCVDWMLVGFYGPPYYSEKKKAWGNLFALLESHQGPWAIMRDFNYIVNEEEQLGGNKGGPSATNYLKELLFEFNAVDLGYSRNKYTWARGAIKSDHAPILMDTNPCERFAHKPFRFEAVWLRDERCSAVIKEAWKGKVSGSEFVKLYKKQAVTREALRKWNKEVFRRCQDRINSLLKKIKEVLHLKMDFLKKIFKPSSRNGSLEVKWRRNNKDAIKNEEGTWIHESGQIKDKFWENFINLFKEEEVYFPEHLDHLVLPCITEEENEGLICIPTPEEIKDVLFQMQGPWS